MIGVHLIMDGVLRHRVDMEVGRRILTELPALIEELPALRAWLDKAVALPEIQQTLPEPDAVRDRYRSRYAAASN